ncbi:MAG TPA: LacI family DNA-binding transcriptional regulator [Dongiaceae bacterium]|nr:LacI family DNA-binding transcriptional regulator [Dongiaceae bacterium]
MAQRYTIKQIAAQAGISTATVDRVLNGRPGVHHQTRLRVERAIAELDRRAAASLAIGWNLYVDVIMHSPLRFTALVQAAVERALADLDPFRVSARFHLFEDIGTPELVRRIEARAADRPGGIILKASDEPAIADAVDRVTALGVPVVTLVTDLPRSRRLAYVGMDNRAAGRTAAFLLGRILGDRRGAIIAHVGSHNFQGEEEREIGFRALLRERFPRLSVVEVSGSYGLDRETRRRVGASLKERRDIVGVYSMGGGNRGILEAFDDAGRPVLAYIGHDLDAENRALLEAGRIDAIIDHDLIADARDALRAILHHHRRIEARHTTQPSRAMVITRYNM